MDSLPQELVDAIIDNVPESSFLSCSLVAKRWRRKSQQCAFDSISFMSENQVNRWRKNIPQDSNGIPSYVRSAQFVAIPCWTDPALFGRVLKDFTSLKMLYISETGIPKELSGSISRGGIGKGITTLMILYPWCSHITTVSIILSLPNLKELRIENDGFPSEEPLPMHPVVPHRRPLYSLTLRENVIGVGGSLVKYRFTSTHLSLDVHIRGVEQLLMLSSETVVELRLYDTSVGNTRHPIHLPFLPALITLKVDLCADVPSPRLTNILYSIDSAPALTSITIEYKGWDIIEHLPSGPWVDVDRWLSRIVKHTKVAGGLPLTLELWPEGKSVWEGFLHRFMEAGGKLVVSVAWWWW